MKYLSKVSTFTITFLLLLSSCVDSTEVISLFNGNDLDGWSAWNRHGGETINALERFEVSEGMIRMHGSNGGYLKSDDTYSNFDLSLDFRWNTDTLFQPQKESRNSGVMYNVPLDAPNSWFPRGIQFQVQSEKTGDFILLKDATMQVRGAAYGPGASVVVERMASVANPDGEWNKLRIVSVNGNVKQYLNGHLVNEGNNSSETSGRILLCYETAPIDFRNIYISSVE